MPAEELPADVLAARQKLKERMGENGAQIGGKGSMRRKSKPIPKSSHNDEKKVGEICKKAGLQEIGGIEEANIIMNDGKVVQFSQPKLRGLMPANCFVLHGNTSETNISKLSPEMKGDYAGAQRPAFDPVAMGNTMRKIQQVMMDGKFTQEDLKDPKKTQEFQEALLKAGVTEQELKTMQQGMTGEMPAGPEDDDELPALSGDKTFEDVSDAD